MNRVKVMILGANGFVGQNLAAVLDADPDIEVSCTSRNATGNQIPLDLLQPGSWQKVLDIKPDIVIDASGYGVVKNQTDLHSLYQVNYLGKRSFVDFLLQNLPGCFWIQIGTAFEYSLDEQQLHENSLCLPKTHYGISKWLFSNYLRNTFKENFAIFRPFGMFGEGEDISKFFPLLILAQKNKSKIDLSDGSQFRDYFYIKDLANFILSLIKRHQLPLLATQVINVGSGKAESIRELSNIIATQIDDFDPELWNWGAIAQRQGENDIFFNSSMKAEALGLVITDLQQAFQNTVNYYYNL